MHVGEIAVAGALWRLFDMPRSLGDPLFAVLAIVITILLLTARLRTSEVASFDTTRLVGVALIVSSRPVLAALCVAAGCVGIAIRRPIVAHLFLANIAHSVSGVLFGALAFHAIAAASSPFSPPWLAGAGAMFALWSVLDFAVFATFVIGGYQTLEDAVADWRKETWSLLTVMAPLSILVGYGLIGHGRWYLLLLFVPQLLMSDVLKRSDELVESEVEKRELRQTFTRYVPESVVEQMIDGGEGIELGGEQREITVLFCDIRGFTSWSENLEPSVIVEELNRLLSELSDCVFATGGTLDKFTGDGLMAFWGAPVEHPQHAMFASEAAQLMVARVASFNRRGGTVFRLGIGLHSGQAVVGNIGHSDRHDYTAIGDTVNLSARIESATKELDASALISESTFVALPVATRSAYADAGEITVKGRVQPVRVFRLLDMGNQAQLAS